MENDQNADSIHDVWYQLQAPPPVITQTARTYDFSLTHKKAQMFPLRICVVSNWRKVVKFKMADKMAAIYDYL